MKVKFAELLQSYGVTADQTTVKIREGKKAFDEAWGEYQEALEEYKETEDPEEKEALMEELNQFEADLQEADEELTKKVQAWYKNKDSWAATKVKMDEARSKKLGKPVGAAATQSVAANQGSSPQPQQNTYAQPVAGEEEEGMSGWGWVLGLGLAVLTLGVGAKFLKRS